MCGQRASVVQASPQEKRHIHRRLADFAVAVSWPEDGHGRAVFQCLVRTLEIVKANPRFDPGSGLAAIDDTRAFHAEPNAVKRDEIAARQLHALKQHYVGKLWLSDVKEMFEQMRDHA